MVRGEQELPAGAGVIVAGPFFRGEVGEGQFMAGAGCEDDVAEEDEGPDLEGDGAEVTVDEGREARGCKSVRDLAPVVSNACHT